MSEDDELIREMLEALKEVRTLAERYKLEARQEPFVHRGCDDAIDRATRHLDPKS